MSALIELGELLGGGESQFVEFKQSIPRDLLFSPSSFDAEICDDFSFPDDMHSSAYETWQGSLPAGSAKMSPEELLPKLSAAEQHLNGLLLSNAAVLMFANEPLRFIPHCQVVVTFKPHPKACRHN